MALHEVLDVQPRQRFAHRRAGHVEGLREPGFGQTFAEGNSPTKRLRLSAW
jgi:hypothetical protein